MCSKERSHFSSTDANCFCVKEQFTNHRHTEGKQENY